MWGAWNMNRLTPWKEVINAVEEFHPPFGADLIGATESEVVTLEKEVGTPLPWEYHEFLLRMGHGLGGLSIATSDFDIDTVYRNYGQSTWKPPGDLVLIAEQQDEEIGFDVYLSLKKGQEGRIIRTVLGLSFPNDVVADEVVPVESEAADEALCLQSLVFTNAFVQFRVGTASTRCLYIPDENEISGDAERLFRSCEFYKHPLSDDWSTFYERHDCVVAVLRPNGSRTQFVLGASPSYDLAHFSRLVQTELGMRTLGSLHT